jgi:adenylylsulfate kinase-like enzyme
MSGFVVWFTGLSASGKTTVANISGRRLDGARPGAEVPALPAPERA